LTFGRYVYKKNAEDGMTDQEIRLRQSYKQSLAQQTYSPTSVVSVLRQFLMDALTWAMANGGRSDKAVIFLAFRSAEVEWGNFCLEIHGEVTVDDFHHEFSQFFLEYADWRKWRKENPPNEGPLQ
jgi:hypothetical protein